MYTYITQQGYITFAQIDANLDETISRLNTKENSANKVTNLEDPNDTTYPSTSAIVTHIQNLVTDNVPEDAFPINLYYTNARVKAYSDTVYVSLNKNETVAGFKVFQEDVKIANGNGLVFTNFNNTRKTSIYANAGGQDFVINFPPANGIVALTSNLIPYTLQTRLLTINGLSYSLSADRTWNVGTVTSIGVSVPIGLSVSNTPVTQSGTIAIGLQAGYSIPTTVKQSQWDSAYNYSLVGHLALAGGTMVGGISMSGGFAIDSTLSGGSDVLNIGTSSADIINIGWAGATVNIIGSRIFSNTVTDWETSDKLIRLNRNGIASSGASVGFEVEEAGIATGYFATNSARNGWDFKAPTTSQLTLGLDLLTVAQIIKAPNATGTIVLNDNAATLTNKTWNGVSIGDAYISSATAWNAKQNALLGTGYVKSTAGEITYDNNNYVLLSPGSAQTGTINMSSNITSGATILGLNGVFTTSIANNAAAYSTGGYSVLVKNTGNNNYQTVPSTTFLTAYSETDTLATVTGRAATTTVLSTFNGGIAGTTATFSAPMTITTSGGNILAFRRGSDPQIQLYQDGTNYGFYNTSAGLNDLLIHSTTGAVTLRASLTGTSATFSSSRSSAYILEAFNTNTVAGTSFGMFIKAGTNASDFALNINNAANTVSLFQVLGNGAVNVAGALSGTSATMGIAKIGTWTSGATYARFGYSANEGTNYGFLQRNDGVTFIQSSANIEVQSPISGTSATFSGNLNSALIRATGAGNFGGTGVGVELQYDVAATMGYVLSYDRATSTAKPLTILSSSTVLTSALTGTSATFSGILYGSRIDVRSGNSLLFWNPTNVEYRGVYSDASNNLIFNQGGTIKQTFTSGGGLDLTGALTGTSATFSGNLSVRNDNTAGYYVALGSVNGNGLMLYNGTTGNSYVLNMLNDTTVGSIINLFGLDRVTANITLRGNGTANFNGAVTATGGFFNSDERWKTFNDETFNTDSIVARSFRWNEFSKKDDGKNHYAYKAQDVYKVMPDAIDFDAKGYMSVNYNEVFVSKIHRLEQRVKELELKLQNN